MGRRCGGSGGEEGFTKFFNHKSYKLHTRIGKCSTNKGEHCINSKV